MPAASAVKAAKKKSARSGNPAVKAAAAKAVDLEEQEAQAAREAQGARIREEFANLELPAPVFDEDGYEIIPDRSAEEGGSYKFKVKGQPFILPKIQYLPLAVAQQMKDAQTDTEAQLVIFQRYAPDLLAYAGSDELLHVMKRWTEYSKGLGLGE